MRRFLAPLFAVVALVASCVISNPTARAQQTQGVSVPFGPITANGASPIYKILGFSSCGLNVDNIGNATLTAYVTNDANPTLSSQWTKATNLGSTGVITTVGIQTGNVATQGLAAFYFTVTGLTTGSVSGSLTCSIAGGAGSGTSGSVTIVGTVTTVCSTLPCPVTTAPPPSPLPTIGAAQPTPTAGTPYLAVINAGPSPLAVTTPPPAPTQASGAQSSTVCDPTTANQCASVNSANALKIFQAPVSGSAGTGVTSFGVLTFTNNTVQGICSVTCNGYTLTAYNGTAAFCMGEEFNVASGSVSLGTTVPVRLLPLAASSSAADALPPTIGHNFTVAWSIVFVTAYNGSTACGSTVYAWGDKF